jgi:hypothetical protein
VRSGLRVVLVAAVVVGTAACARADCPTATSTLAPASSATTEATGTPSPPPSIAAGTVSPSIRFVLDNATLPARAA